MMQQNFMVGRFCEKFLARHQQFVELDEIYYLGIYSSSLRCVNCLKHELNVHLIHLRAGIICLLHCFCEGKTCCELTKREYFGKNAFSDLRSTSPFLCYSTCCFNRTFQYISKIAENILQPSFWNKEINIY